MIKMVSDSNGRPVFEIFRFVPDLQPGKEV